jgi:hypothetical protein
MTMPNILLHPPTDDLDTLFAMFQLLPAEEQKRMLRESSNSSGLEFAMYLYYTRYFENPARTPSPGERVNAEERLKKIYAKRIHTVPESPISGVQQNAAKED